MRLLRLLDATDLLGRRHVDAGDEQVRAQLAHEVHRFVVIARAPRHVHVERDQQLLHRIQPHRMPVQEDSGFLPAPYPHRKGRLSIAVMRSDLADSAGSPTQLSTGVEPGCKDLRKKLNFLLGKSRETSAAATAEGGRALRRRPWSSPRT